MSGKHGAVLVVSRRVDERRIAYGVTFLVSGAGWFLVAPRQVVGAAAVGWWAVSMLCVGFIYLAGRPSWFGKRADGSRHALAWTVLWPYLALTWALWWLRRFSREPAWHEVAPGLFLGRRCAPHELPPGVAKIIDVTAELSPSAGASVCVVVPMLDGCGMPEDALSRAVGAADAPRVFVHCLAGHGRSACVAAAILVSRGLASNPAEAVVMLKRTRSGVSLSPGQRRALEQWHARVAAG